MHTVKRKTPAELNNRRIPSKQPRLHVSFSDDQNSLNISDVSGSISRLRSRTISILNGQQIKPIRISIRISLKSLRKCPLRIHQERLKLVGF